MSRSITENCVSHIEERGKIAPPSAHHKWIECYFKLLLCVAKPYIGEVAHSDGGVKQYNNRTIFLTPLLRNYRSFGLSPIFCVAKHRGEGAIPTAVTKLSPPSLPAMPRSITGSCKTACKEYGDETYCSVSWTKGESDLCHTLMSYFFKCIMINGNIQ